MDRKMKIVAQAVADVANGDYDYSEDWGDVDSQAFALSQFRGCDAAWAVYVAAWEKEWLRRRAAAQNNVEV